MPKKKKSFWDTLHEALAGKDEKQNVHTEEKDYFLERTTQYENRLQYFLHWNGVLSQVLRRLSQAKSVSDVGLACVEEIHREFEDATVIFAAGKLEKLLLMQAFSKRYETDLWFKQGYMYARPIMEQGLIDEVVSELFQSLNTMEHHKPWYVFHDVSQEVRQMLTMRKIVQKEFLLIPLTRFRTVIGLLFITGPFLSQHHDALQDAGNNARIIADAVVLSIFTYLSALQPNLGTDAEIVAIAQLQIIDILKHGLAERMETVNQEVHWQDFEHFLSYPLVASNDAVFQVYEDAMRLLTKYCYVDLAVIQKFHTEDETPDTVYGICFENRFWSPGMHHDHQLDMLAASLEGHPEPLTEFVCKGQSHVLLTPDELQVHAPRILSEGMQSATGIPIKVRQQCFGMILLARKEQQPWTEEERDFGELIAMQLGMYHQQHTIMQELMQVRMTMYSSWNITIDIALQTLQTMTDISKLHGIMVSAQPEMVSEMAVKIARRLDQTPEDVFAIRVAALLCDIGTIAVPTNILRKKEGLTDSEWRLMKNHPLASIGILKHLTILEPVLKMIRHHHEHYDGSGYPDSLRSASIPFGARIIAVADAYISMQLNRPYRPAMGKDEVITHLLNSAGHQFDPVVVETLVEIVTKQHKAA